MESSGADKGFFQTPPVLKNQVYDDVAFQRCFKLFLPRDVAQKVEREIAELGDEVISDQVFAWITDSEHNKPRLRGEGRDAFGQWRGELLTGEGWRGLQNFGLSHGFVAAGYDTPYGPYSRAYQFLRLQLWSASSANVTCPSAMQDGAARLLQTHLTTPSLAARLSAEEKKVFQNAFDHLVSRDLSKAWTSGQWMTERTGGSDVSLTETMAVYHPNAEGLFSSRKEETPLGPWSINGFKWFSSATDSNMTVLLAKTPKGGLSTFLAPMRKHDPKATTLAGLPRPDGETLNGVRIQRLKNKLGTQSLPTAELVLEDMRGWLIGQEGRGIHEVSTILSLTRIHSAVGAVSYVGRGLSIARAYAQVRVIGAGKGARVKLAESSLHMRTLAKMTAEYRRLMLLTMFTSYLLGLTEHPPEASYADASPALKALTVGPALTGPLLRVLTQLTKAYVCKPAVSLLFSCMESLGGVGYLLNEEQEHLNIARLYRDCTVLPIWEGTTDVLSTDFIRALKHPKAGKDSMDALGEFIKSSSEFQGKTPKPDGWDPVKAWEDLRSRIESESSANLMAEAREILWAVGNLLVSVLLYVDAGSDGDGVSKHIFDLFLEETGVVERLKKASTDDALARDTAIVYGAPHDGITSKL